MLRRPHLVLAMFALVVLTGCGLGGFDDLLSPFGGSSDEYAGPPGPDMRADEYAMAREVFQLTNDERRRAGMEELRWDEKASLVAYEHCADMRMRGFIAHVNPDGDDAGDRLDRAGIDTWLVGENIHYRAPPGTAMSAVTSWLASAGHRDALLFHRFTHTGVGVHSDGDHSWWVQVFYTP